MLYEQTTDEVEILTDIDSGDKTIGRKRQDLLEKSIGSYLVYIDDDDTISKTYIKRILMALEASPDVIGLKGGWIKENGLNQIWWGLNYDWRNCGDHYEIGTNHITPVKREIALKAGFPDISIGEDQVYGRRVRKLAKTEIVIDEMIYFYNCDPKHQDVYECVKRHGR